MAEKNSIRQMRYDEEHRKKYYLNLHLEADADIIEAIGEINKQGTIKQLIRDGIKYRKNKRG